MRRIISIIVGLVLVGATAAQAASPVKIIDTKGADETPGAIADGWVAWSANTAANQNLYHGYVKPDGGAVRKIPVKAGVNVGSIATDGPRAGELSFELLNKTGSDIKFYDLSTKAIRNPPAGVNTSKREWNPSASGDYLLFGRGPTKTYASTTVLLYRFSKARFITVASSAKSVFTADQVNGDYVAYTKCTATACDVYRYRISNQKTVRVPRAPTGRANYWSAVLPDGTTYWVQGNFNKCGKNTKILRWKSGTPTTVVSVPDGIELVGLEAQVVGASPVVIFGEYACKSGDYGLYKVDG
jgi:hypothetical protein